MLNIPTVTEPCRVVQANFRPQAQGTAIEGGLFRPLIDGERTGGDPQPVALIDPATAQRHARIRHATGEDIDRAAEAAARASLLWRSIPVTKRVLKLRRLAELIQEQASHIARVITQEQGKPWLEALHLEVLPALDHLKFISESAEGYHADVGVEPQHPLYAHKQSLYLHEPMGVVALITPLPLPFAIGLVQVASALAMGNAVVLKPSEYAPLSGLRIGELCMEAGFPAGLVNVVPALPPHTMRLVTHPKVDKVFFTGGVEAGRRVLVTTGCEMRPAVLRLGGKHPSVVAGDADLDLAARGVVWGALANGGQNCGSIERVYVEECVASEFINRVLREVKKLRVGNPLTAVELGPLQSGARRAEVHRQVSDAVQQGARLLCGGVLTERPGFFYPPTVLLSAPNDCDLMQKETLGPVIPITTVDSIERAILLANESEFALTASGWTTSQYTAQRLMTGLPGGVVTINDVLYSFGEPAAAWSGYRNSGQGQSHGIAGLREMSRQRFVSLDNKVTKGPLLSFPYDGKALAIARSALELLHGKQRLRRLAALGRLLRIKRFRARVSLRSLLSPGNLQSRKR